MFRLISCYWIHLNRRYIGEDMFHIDLMKADDFSFAVRLANSMNWNMTTKDFALMSSIEPFGCFVLYDNKEKLGISTCVSYDGIGWFGNFIIKEGYRNKGAGSFLLQTSLTYLRNKGVQTIGLYSYPELIGFYKKFGFRVDYDVIVFQGVPSLLIKNDGIELAQKKDFSRLLDFDKKCVGFSRFKTLYPIFIDKNNFTYFSIQNDLLNAFIVTKIFNKQAEVGPLVFKPGQEALAIDLLKFALSDLSHFEVFIYVPKKNEEFKLILLKSGLKESLTLVRMLLGPFVNKNILYLPESLERG